MIEFDCYVRTSSHAYCGLCSEKMEDGDGYCRMKLNTYTNTYFHGHCLIEAGKGANSHKNMTEAKKKLIEKEKTQRKKKVGDMNWRKRICREALKDAGLNPKNYRFSSRIAQADPWVEIISKTEIRSGSQHQMKKCGVQFKGNAMVSVGINHWSDMQRRDELTLAGPDALKKIGESMKKYINSVLKISW